MGEESLLVVKEMVSWKYLEKKLLQRLQKRR